MGLRLTAGILTLGLLAGCLEGNSTDDVPSFYYSNTSPKGSNITKKLKDCAVESFQKVPARTVVNSSPRYNTPIRCNTFGTQTSCTGGSYGGQVSSYDENDSLRDDVRMQCLKKVDVHRSYVFGQNKSCPKGFTQGGFGGWFDGRLKAQELAKMQVGQYLNWGYNSEPKQDKFLKSCVVNPSLSSTSRGTVSRLIDFPENFVKLSAEDRAYLVATAKYQYPKLTKRFRSLNTAMTFESLTKKMQANIDFCTKKIGVAEFAQELRIIISSEPGFQNANSDMKLFSDVSFKNLCIDGNLPY